ncbi:DUF3656 domain-containing U32 family peptidase [Heliophilum fasciatum]|uniref:Putative protease n=1 Tax=Heliophilum fasciatum TaxID=35700 RepID=A0A4R2RZ45_9FIRM|nr:U32 family peptidase [Heliophilum fasciatum]MCW2276771.1 putative protease [Heliophilum fasciatum]TCP68848.1 putative protease [Heliophilum fasciatum]
MNEKKKRANFDVELLAPVGSPVALRAAVENGADAVYLSGKQFGARQYAANFDLDELAQAVEYAHGRDVAVYVTVNTLLTDEEISALPAYGRDLARIGVDAVIVQDIGVLRVLRQVLPEMVIHASTQMTVSNVEGARRLAQEGVQRVVLARELSLEAMEQIARLPGVEIEVFVHGALCICYSGQCLMSSLIGGRSGNRGRCAQPCRLNYSLVDAAGHEYLDARQTGAYLLSPRDIKMIESLPELLRAGVKSLKIEGRMKRPEYVATAVRQYRQALDRALQTVRGEQEAPFAPTVDEERALRQIFNRDFSSGYLYGPPGKELMSLKRPNHRGLFLGRIRRYDAGRRQALLLLEEPLHTGDELEAWVTRGGRTVTTVETMTVQGKTVPSAQAGQEVLIPWAATLHPGDRIFKTQDHLLVAEAQASYLRPSEAPRRTALRATVRAFVGQPVEVTFWDEAGHQGTALTTEPAQVAQRHPLTEATLKEQLGRLGNTPFVLASLSLQSDGKAMVPVRLLNEARREAIQALSQERQQRFQRIEVDEATWQQRLEQLQWRDYRRACQGAPQGRKEMAPKKSAPQLPLLTVAVEGLEAVRAATRAGADEIYIGTDGFRHLPVDDCSEIVALCHRQQVQPVVALPRLYRPEQKESVTQLIERWVHAGASDFVVPNLGYLELLQQHPVKWRADYPLWSFNAQAVHYWLERGAQAYTVSPELTLSQLTVMGRCLSQHDNRAIEAAELIVHGAMPMMVTEYCLPGALLGQRGEKPCAAPCKQLPPLFLRDRMNFLFPLHMDGFCRMHIFNPKTLALLESWADLLPLAIGRWRMEMRTEPPAKVQTIVQLYRQIIDQAHQPGNVAERTSTALAQLQQLYPAGTTKGHLYRGVE